MCVSCAFALHKSCLYQNMVLAIPQLKVQYHSQLQPPAAVELLLPIHRQHRRRRLQLQLHRPHHHPAPQQLQHQRRPTMLHKNLKNLLLQVCREQSHIFTTNMDSFYQVIPHVPLVQLLWQYCFLGKFYIHMWQIWLLSFKMYYFTCSQQVLNT